MPLWRGELKARALPGIARDLGIDALEWTSRTFRDLNGGRELMFEAPAQSCFQDLRREINEVGVQNKLLNVGGSFFLASGDAAVRQQALNFIMQYVEPARSLGCDILRAQLYYEGDGAPLEGG
jgi:hypothetical protein